MKKLKRAWGIADHPDAERWDGAFATREEAIEEGRALFPGAPFWVVQGTYPDPADFLPRFDWIIDTMQDNASTHVGEIAEEWPPATKESETALTDALAKWARKHAPIRFFAADGEKERIEPLPNKRWPMAAEQAGADKGEP